MSVLPLSVILGDFGNVHLDGNAMAYLAVAYALFFVAIFAYVISLSRRQARAQADLALLRRAVDEEQAKLNNGK